MSYVQMSDYLGCCGMGDDGFTIYPDAQTALKQPQSYGYLYKQGDQIMLSGPAGPIIVKSTQIFQDGKTALGQPGSYGYIYQQGSDYYVTGPYGPLKIRSPYTPSAQPGTVLSLPPLPTAPSGSILAPPTALVQPSAPSVYNTPMTQPNVTNYPITPNSGGFSPSATPTPPPANNALLYGIVGLGAIGIVGLALFLRKKPKSQQQAQYGYAPPPPYGYPPYGYQQPYYPPAPPQPVQPRPSTPAPPAPASAPPTRANRWRRPRRVA